MTNQMNDKLIINQHIHSNQHIRTTTNNTPAAQLTHRIYHKSTSNINNRRRLVRFRNGLFQIVNNISRQRPPQSTIPTITPSQAIVQKPIRRKPLISTATVGPTIQTVILAKHQPTHQIRTNLRTKVRKNRLLNTRPSIQPTFQASLNTTTLPQTTTIISTTTIPTITTTTVFSPVGQVDDIEAAVLRAVIDSSTTTPIPIQPSTLRARTHRLKNSFSRSRPLLILPPLRPPLPSSSSNPIDSIEAAVLQAVLTTTVPTTTVETTTIETSTVPLTTTTTTTITTVPPTLFPAFATKRRPINVEVPTTTTTVPTSLPMTTISSNLNETTLTQPITTTTVPSTTTTTLIFEETTVASTVENKPNENQVVDENLKLREIEQNVIAALTSSPIPPPTSRGPPGIAPPASLNSAGPPGSQPPSDEIVDELNVANNFMEVAQKFNLFKRLLQ